MNLNMEKPEEASKLIVSNFCGETIEPKLTKEDKKLIKRLTKNAQNNNLNHSQLNELLLLLNQDIVEEDFFKFFFTKDKISLDELKTGIIKFIGYSMLCFGNIKYAFKLLSKKKHDEIFDLLRPYSENPSRIINKYRKRSEKIIEIEKINEEETWLVGETTDNKINQEGTLLKNEMEKCKENISKFKKEELIEYGEIITRIKEKEKKVQEIARLNTDIYLTWDYMDIYVATSMRNNWEYEETYKFIEQTFNTKELKDFKLRFFDPTQSKCGNTRDKGIIEGLMLKRAFCTIYLSQESDTMGKDSELAATLAQKKPVIAYVPEHDPTEYAEVICEHSLQFFKKRFLILEAEEIFDNPECNSKLLQIDSNFKKTIKKFLNTFDDCGPVGPFRLWKKKENEFKEKYEDFKKLCKILATAECAFFEKRAYVLKELHPLAMQIDLESGVANGVLVVRNHEDCANLLYKILTNQLEFEIEHIEEEDEIRHNKEGFSVLKEKISQSSFRVITHQSRITNSFWNRFHNSK